MQETKRPDQSKKLNDDAEQSTAKDEPMGSVAAAVPRDSGSAPNIHSPNIHGKEAPPDECENKAPDHQGGHATLVAGSDAHKAEKPDQNNILKEQNRDRG
jgi:hypothetical protein